jgi:guanine deaminase
MDRNCPEYLQDTPQASFEGRPKSLLIIGISKARLQYAITPRFAIRSSAAQLENVLPSNTIS